MKYMVYIYIYITCKRRFYISYLLRDKLIIELWLFSVYFILKLTKQFQSLLINKSHFILFS